MADVVPWYRQVHGTPILFPIPDRVRDEPASRLGGQILEHNTCQIDPWRTFYRESEAFSCVVTAT